MKAPGALRAAADWFREIVDKWAGPAGLGSFVLYLLGYLSFRFHFSALGLPFEWNVIDERYFFAGARAAVNLAAALPLGLGLLILTYLPLSWLWCRLGGDSWPFFRRASNRAAVSVLFCLLALSAVFFACLDLLPLSSNAAKGTWLSGKFLAHMKAGESGWPDALLGFEIFLLGVAGALYRWSESQTLDPWPGFLRTANAGLLILMILLLPVNYGIVTERYTGFPAQKIGEEAVGEGRHAWLVSESKEWLHYMTAQGKARTFVSVPAAGLKRLELGPPENLIPFVLVDTVEVPPTTGIFRFGPVNIMSEEPDVKPGDIMMVNLQPDCNPQGDPVIVSRGSFRWPVVQPGSGQIFAMQDPGLLVQASPGSAPKVVGRIAGLRQLIDFAGSDPDSLVVKTADGYRTYQVSRQESKPALTSAQAAQLDTIVAKQSRAYGPKTLEARVWNSGSRLFLRSEQAGEVLLADCPDVVCGQPSLAPGERQVVFIRGSR